MEQYARYRAPAESGQTLVAPPWSEIGALTHANRAWRARADIEIAGQPLAEFAAAARRELLAFAARYVATYHPAAAAIAPDVANIADRPLILAGHQPEVFHPGVWVKNFAAAALAKSLGGTALNLVIDGDACRGTSLRVPSGTISQPHFASIEFDGPFKKLPWEERPIVNADLWQSFPDRVREATASLLPARMLDDWWPAVVKRGMATRRIGLALAQARHLAEIEWDQHNLEAPHSEMCRTETFRRFACHILSGLPRFVDAYNGALNDYRRVHGVRNHAHPVPNLTSRDGWLQAPFWVWSADDPRRRAVFARRDALGLILSDFTTFERPLPLVDDSEWAPAVAELDRWERQGLKFRSRALVTTMFARLAVADLFIHGIGGAKYDEATDAVCRRFFSAAPPQFAAVSGTLRLPISHTGDGEGHVRRLRQSLREIAYHPEQFLPPEQAPAGRSITESLVLEKRRWIETEKSPDNGKVRHAAILSVNGRLQPFVAGRRLELECQLARYSEQTRANRILDSREYAFCLFPRSFLEQFLLDFPMKAL